MSGGHFNYLDDQVRREIVGELQEIIDGKSVGEDSGYRDAPVPALPKGPARDAAVELVWATEILGEWQYECDRWLSGDSGAERMTGARKKARTRLKALLEGTATREQLMDGSGSVIATHEQGSLVRWSPGR